MSAPACWYVGVSLSRNQHSWHRLVIHSNHQRHWRRGSKWPRSWLSPMVGGDGSSPLELPLCKCRWEVNVSLKVTTLMQCATLATTFGVYFAHLTTRAEEEEEQLPSALVSSVPSIMAFTMFFFCPISTALSKVFNCVIIPWKNFYQEHLEFPLSTHFPQNWKFNSTN